MCERWDPVFRAPCPLPPKVGLCVYNISSVMSPSFDPIGPTAAYLTLALGQAAGLVRSDLT